MQSNYNGQSTRNQPSYSESSSSTLNTSRPDPATAMAVLFSLDQADLIVLEYIGKQLLDTGRGVTVEDVMPVLGLSNAATSIRLRRLSESEFKDIEIELLRRVREGENGANLHYLNGVTLDVIQSVMAKRGFSYEKYWARRKKRVHTADDEYVDASAPNTKNIQEQEVVETPTSESQQPDFCLDSRAKETDVDEIFEKEIEPTESFVETKPVSDPAANVSSSTEKSPEDIADSLLEPLILRKTVALLLQQIVSIKQEYTSLKQENANFKEELTQIKSHLAELEQKLKEESNNKLQATLDQLLTLNQNQMQNGIDRY